VSVTGRPGRRSWRNAGHDSGPGNDGAPKRTAIIGQILTDEELRAEFLEWPHATDGEVDALVQTIAGCGGVAKKWIDSRFQRCRLTRGRQIDWRGDEHAKQVLEEERARGRHMSGVDTSSRRERRMHEYVG
jgi:hypothetical protein